MCVQFPVHKTSLVLFTLLTCTTKLLTCYYCRRYWRNGLLVLSCHRLFLSTECICSLLIASIRQQRVLLSYLRVTNRMGKEMDMTLLLYFSAFLLFRSSSGKKKNPFSRFLFLPLSLLLPLPRPTDRPNATASQKEGRGRERERHFQNGVVMDCKWALPPPLSP